MNEKAPTCGASAEPSDGLEPPTPPTMRSGPIYHGTQGGSTDGEIAVGGELLNSDVV
jgi:hypothetical protein